MFVRSGDGILAERDLPDTVNPLDRAKREVRFTKILPVRHQAAFMHCDNGVLVAKQGVYTPSIQAGQADGVKVAANMVEDAPKIVCCFKVSPSRESVHILGEFEASKELFEVAGQQGFAGLPEHVFCYISRSFRHKIQTQQLDT